MKDRERDSTVARSFPVLRSLSEEETALLQIVVRWACVTSRNPCDCFSPRTLIYYLLVVWGKDLLPSGMAHCLDLDDKTLGKCFKYNTFPVIEIYAQKWPHGQYLVAGGRESRLTLSLNVKEPLSGWARTLGLLLDLHLWPLSVCSGVLSAEARCPLERGCY